VLGDDLPVVLEVTALTVATLELQVELLRSFQ